MNDDFLKRQIITYIGNKRKFISIEFRKSLTEKIEKNFKVLFITIISIIIMVIVTITLHLVFIEKRRWDTAPITNNAVFDTLIGIACAVAFVYFFFVFIRTAKITNNFKETNRKGSLAATILLVGLMVLLVAGVMNTSVDPSWVYERDAYYITKNENRFLCLYLGINVH